MMKTTTADEPFSRFKKVGEAACYNRDTAKTRTKERGFIMENYRFDAAGNIMGEFKNHPAETHVRRFGSDAEAAEAEIPVTRRGNLTGVFISRGRYRVSIEGAPVAYFRYIRTIPRRRGPFSGPLFLLRRPGPGAFGQGESPDRPFSEKSENFSKKSS